MPTPATRPEEGRMIVSIVSEGQNVGHAGLMFERLKRLHETMRARGASEAAIARLPKLPVLTPRTPPKLPMLLAAPQKEARVPIQRRPNPPTRRKEGRSDETTADMLLYARIITLVAAEFAVAETELAGRHKRDRIAPIRHICWQLLREFTGLSSQAIARILGGRCHTTVLNGFDRAKVLLTMPRYAAGYRSVKAILLRKHRIVDDLGIAL